MLARKRKKKSRRQLIEWKKNLFDKKSRMGTHPSTVQGQ